MSTVVYFLPIIIWLILFTWYVTCTEHDKIAWIVPISITGIMCIPIINIIISALLIIFLTVMFFSGDLEIDIMLKDNWVNRFFLGYTDDDE